MQFFATLGLGLALVAQTVLAAPAFTSFPPSANKVGDVLSLTYSPSAVSS